MAVKTRALHMMPAFFRCMAETSYGERFCMGEIFD
jgi:hypothetical protein